MTDNKIQEIIVDSTPAETFRKWAFFGLSVLVIIGSGFGAWYGAAQATSLVNARVDKVEIKIDLYKEATDKDLATVACSLREKELHLLERIVTIKQEGTLISQQNRRDLIAMQAGLNRMEDTIDKIADKIGVIP